MSEGPVAGGPWPRVDFSDPALADDPWAIYAQLRDGFPLFPATFGTRSAWVLSRHADVRRVLDDPAARMRRPGEVAPPALGDGPAARMWRSSVSLMDPPDHARVRRPLAAGFTRKRIDGLRPLVSGVVDEVFDAVRGRECIDVVRDIALAIPMRVICGVLGVPASDWPMLESWTPDFLRIFQPDALDPAMLPRVDRASRDFIDYFGRLLEERRRAPRDDLATEIARQGGEALSADEQAGALRGLLTAGFETTASTLSATAAWVSRDPSLLGPMRRGERERTLLAEEVLRWESPVRAHFRVLGEAAEFHGRRLEAGSQMLLLLGAANHDPRAFAEPEAIVPGRLENPHVAFGGGRHICLGASLARVELERALARMARDWDGLVPESAGVRRRHNAQFPAIEELRVRPLWRG